MRRNSRVLPKHLIILATLLAMALTLAFGGIASAATVPATAHVLPVPCLSATPPTQLVALGQPAKIAVKIGCYPASSTFFEYLTATWGDGAITRYPLCVEVCHVPPIIIDTSHVYRSLGLYKPTFCLTPGITALPYCTQAEVQVLPLV